MFSQIVYAPPPCGLSVPICCTQTTAQASAFGDRLLHIRYGPFIFYSGCCRSLACFAGNRVRAASVSTKAASGAVSNQQETTMKRTTNVNELIHHNDAELYAMLEAEYATLATHQPYNTDYRHTLARIDIIRKAIIHRRQMRSNRKGPTP